MKNAAYQKIKNTGKLPSPSGVALKLMRLVDDEASTLTQITATVESDPALAARMIKLVNSSLYGASRTIASVSTAVNLLGRNTVKNLALGMSLLSSHRKSMSKAFDFEQFWSESVARAVAARGLAKQFGGCAPDEAFTVALLSQIGRIALATAFPMEYDDLLGKVHGSSLSVLLDAERRAFQIDHNDLTVAMMADWRLADVFCEAVRCQNSIDGMRLGDDSRVARISKTLHMAGAMASVLADQKVYREDLAALLETADRFGVGADICSAAFEVAKEEWRNLGTVLSVQTHKVPSLQEAHTRASRMQQRILVVDDDTSVLRLLSKYLKDAGYEVLTATNGIEALRIIHAEGCPLVITDWMMPDMDGLELCQAIRASEGISFAYVIMLTGQCDEDSLAKAFDAGADDFLTKPCKKQELLARLKAGVRALTSETKVATQQLAIHKTNAELETLNGKLQQIATTDELTGLYNRREAMHRLEDYWAKADREGQLLACMMLDIDHFKKCNDTYGHDVGDVVLRETARTLRRNTRAGETVFRLGGEEFVVLCPSSSAKMAAVGAERLRAAVEANRIERGRMSLGITISVGVAELDHRTTGPDDLLKLTDEALYEAKRSGRNRVCVAGADKPTVSQQQPVSQKPIAMTRTRVDHTANGGVSLGTVLVVDDDQSARRLARKLLEREGFEVNEACDGRAALTEVLEIHPDVILMDAVMPNLDGYECTRKLSADQSTCEIPVIMVSGKTDEKHIEAGFDAGANEYITKPYRHREFVLRIRAMAELARGKKDLLASNSIRGEQARAMQILFDLSRSLAAAEQLDTIVSHTVTATAELMNSRRVSLMLPEESGNILFVANSIGIDNELAAKIRVPVGSSISGRVFSSGEPTIFNSQDERIECSDRYESGFFASIPLASKALVVPHKIVGVLNVTERYDRQPFEPHEIEYLDLVCNMAASALEQYESGQAREHAHTAIVIGLAKLAEHRDADTGNHLERVTQYALRLARELKQSVQYASTIDEGFLADLKHAMPLHDIGKVSVPDAILLKPGPLTDTEFTAMKRHAIVGATAIQSVIDQAPEAGFLAMARDIAHGHHEWFNGTGYPRGLAGNTIPFAARIAAVADVYDALTTKRPYKEAFPHSQAVKIIRESSGTHFDPEVVEAFLRLGKDFANLAIRLSDENNDSHNTVPETELVACSTYVADP